MESGKSTSLVDSLPLGEGEDTKPIMLYPEDNSFGGDLPVKRKANSAYTPPVNIRNYFHFNEEGTEATCSCCGKNLKIQKHSTGNLWRHMKCVHKQFENREIKSEDKPLVADFYYDNILKLFVTLGLPLSTVSNPLFLGSQQALCKSVAFPPDYQFLQLLRQKFNLYKDRMKSYLKTASNRISILIGGWANTTMDHHLSLTCSFVSNSQVHELPLELIYCDRDDDKSVFDALMRSLQSFDLIYKVYCIVTDGSPNSALLIQNFHKWAIENSHPFRKNIHWIRTVNHQMNQTAFAFLRGVYPLLDALRRIVLFIVSSEKLKSSFKTVCKQIVDDFKDVKLVPCDLDSWRSIYEMLEHALILRKGIDNFLNTFVKKPRLFRYNDNLIEVSSLKPEDWSCLDLSYQFLNPFNSGISYLEGDSFPPLGYAISLYEVLRNHCLTFPENPMLPPLMSDAVRCTHEYITKYFVPESLLSFAAMVFDPRLKLEVFEDRDWVENPRASLELLKDYFTNNYSADGVSVGGVVVTPSVAPGSTSPTSSDNYQNYKSNIDSIVFRKKRNIDYWDLYFSAPPVIATENFNLLHFWLSSNYGPLNQFALELLSLAGSSIYSDRLINSVKLADEPPFEGIPKAQLAAMTQCLKTWWFYSPLQKMDQFPIPRNDI